jgi:hypothetical protein
LAAVSLYGQFKFYGQYLTHFFVFPFLVVVIQFIERYKKLICKESVLGFAAGDAAATN